MGFLCLVLHGHLPFVRHPEIPECLEEDWFFEAVTEVYLPLLDLFDRLEKEGIDFKVALSLSPTLLAMFQDPLLLSRYDHHLGSLILLSESECQRTQSSEFSGLARMYRDRFIWIKELWQTRFRRDLVGAFREISGVGEKLELLTTAATHGFLPLMEVSPAALRAQVEVGLRSFEAVFGRRPSGFWLPECGYTPRVGQVLAEAGVRYTFLETHGVLHAAPRPTFGVHAPLRSPEGVTFFGRDTETANQVWSAAEGYPGDEWYRDFYRDIGFDLKEEYLRPFLYHGGFRSATGIKYYRITGKHQNKDLYDPGRAAAKAKEHAENFLFNRERQVEHLERQMKGPAVVAATYDAELFGHWWFEGPLWLEEVFRKFQAHREIVRMATPSEALRQNLPAQQGSPHLSTWGWKGYNEVWLQGANAWVYRHLHRAAWRMEELAKAFPRADRLTRRALNQLFRELLLAQSSDWPFALSQGTTAAYAKRRFISHINRFHRLYEQLKDRTIDEREISSLEAEDNLFPFLDYRIYQ